MTSASSETKCVVAIKVRTGVRGIPKDFYINGHQIPGVTNVTVHYSNGDARRVTFELLPTDIIEIDPSDPMA